MTGDMKTKAGPLMVSTFTLLVLAASTASSFAGTEIVKTNSVTGRTNAPVKTTAVKAKDTVKDAVAEGRVAIRQGVEKADTAVTNVVHQIGVEVHKATDVATNVVAKVKVVVTNAVDEVKAEFKEMTR